MNGPMNHYLSSKSDCFAVAQSNADQSARDTVNVKLLCVITLSLTFTSFWSRCVKPGEDRNIEECRKILKHRAIFIYFFPFRLDRIPARICTCAQPLETPPVLCFCTGRKLQRRDTHVWAGP